MTYLGSKTKRTVQAGLGLWLLLVLTGCRLDSSKDPCSDVACSGHGVCAVTGTGPVCACDPGYHPEGLSCVEDGMTGPCYGVDCSGHGTCVGAEGTATCDCEDGYHAEGLSCVEDGTTGPCYGVTCSGHGTCHVVNGSAQCECEAGYLTQDDVTCVEDFAASCAMQYVEEVSIPSYDPTNPEHFLIQTDDDWSHINDSDKIHFYVVPNDYTALGRIELTRSGTEARRRAIALYNGNDDHPGALPRDTVHLAKVLFDVESSYWIIDRMALWDHDTASNYGIFAFDAGAEHNIVNRTYTSHIENAVNIRNGAYDNTIQNSRFEDTEECDAVTILLGGMTDTEAIYIVDTKIVNNEFYNQNMAIMFIRFINPDSGLRQPVDVEGLVCACNQVYLDDDTQPNTSSGFNFAAGSMNPDKPVVITRNMLWGYTGFGNRGDTAVVGYSNVRNAVFTQNVIFDSARCISAGSAGPPDNEGEGGLRTGFAQSELTGNLFYGCGKNDYYPLKLSSYQTIVEENALIDCKIGYLEASGNDAESTFQNNDICNTPDDWNDLGDNDSEFVSTVLDNNHYESAQDAGYSQSLLFTRDRFTDHPTVVSLPHAVRP